MDEKILKLLYDADESIKKIDTFVADITFEGYDNNDLLRSAVERQFEILGETLNRIKKMDETLVASIEGYRGAVSFRNVLIHAYDSIDNIVVWSVIKEDLPKLKKSIENLIK